VKFQNVETKWTFPKMKKKFQGENSKCRNKMDVSKKLKQVSKVKFQNVKIKWIFSKIKTSQWTPQKEGR